MQKKTAWHASLISLSWLKQPSSTKPPWYQWYLVASGRVEQPQRCSASLALQWRSSSPAWTSWPGVNNKTNATTAACKVGRWLKSRSLLFTHAMFFVAPQAPKDSTGNSMENWTWRDVYYFACQETQTPSPSPTLARWARNLPLMMTSTPLAPFSMMNLHRGNQWQRDKKQTASLLQGAWGHHSRHGALPNHQSAWSGGTHTEPWGAALFQFLLQKCMEKYEFIKINPGVKRLLTWKKH